MHISIKKVCNRIKNYIRFYTNINLKTHPVALQIEVTNICNLKCKTCPRHKLKRLQGYIDFEFYKSIIDSEKDYLETVLLFHMGEPLLHPNIHKIVNYANRNRIKTVIFTNGVLLDKKTSMNLLEAGLDLLVVSIDGMKQTFEEIRRGATYEQTLNNILTFKKLSKSYKTSIQLHYVVSSSNFNETKEFIKFFKTKKIYNIRLKKFIDTGGIGEIIGEAIVNRKKFQCMMPWREPVISWNGDVFPCCVDLLGEINLGNVKNSTVFDVWNNEKINKIRMWHKEKKFEQLKICKNCTGYCVSKGIYFITIFLSDLKMRKLISIWERIKNIF